MKLLDTVRLTTNRPDCGLKRGDVGTIVEVFDTPFKAFEVEFVNEQGHTIAELTLVEGDIELAPRHSPPSGTP